MIFAVIGAFLASGCSDMSTAPTGLEDDAALTGTEELGGGLSIEREMDLTPGPEWTVERVVGKHRAVMLLDGEDLTLTFAPKALSGRKVTVVARMELNDERGKATRVDLNLQPSMTFSKPVKLSISSSYLAGTSSTYKLWRYSPELGRPEKVEKSITPGQAVVFELDHFSSYALSR
jgi:hypothetical protein